MALELTMRHGTIKPPLLVVPTPDFKLYRRQDSSDTQLSPSDTPRKNKRKLSEPKRRTTDFSIKRLCPDSPGSACSESGQSEESANERLHDESRDSVSASPTDLSIDRDRLLQHHPHLRPPFMYPSEIPHHPYLVPPFYYGAMPGGYPPPVSVAGYQNLTSPPLVPVPSVHPQVLKPQPQRHSRHSSQEAIKTSNSNTNATKSRASPSPSPVSSNRHVTKKEKEHVSRETPQTSRSSSPRQEETEDNSLESPDSPKDGKRCRKNYKNMTRERRVEANARERTRVHTISAAFDGLRRAVPSYSYNQKLSKLAILRIACSYINALSKLADPDSEDTSATPESTFEECVDTCTRTIQTEGKARRRH